MNKPVSKPWIRTVFVGVSIFFLSTVVLSQSVDPDSAELQDAQAELARQYERLESAAARLAELSESSDPGRSQQLREAIRLGREQDIQTRFTSIVALLEQERLAAASRNQQELARQLELLLEVLLAKPSDSRNDSEQDQLRKNAREIGRLIRAQRSLRARIESAPTPAELAPQQEKLAEKAAEVEQGLTPPSDKSSEKLPQDNQESPGDNSPAENSAENSNDVGKPSEGSSGETGNSGEPMDPQSEKSAPEKAAQRVAAAKQRMKQAQQKLEKNETKEATNEQIAAQRELEQAKEELERRLRQLREEEMQRTLLQLAARFRQMLETQQLILTETEALHAKFGARRERELEINSATLAERERRLTRDADRAMLLLREDGTSVAFPEALEQIRTDMQEVTLRLERSKVDRLTQTIEQDIIAGLQEAVEAMEKAAEDLANRQQQQQPSSSPQGGQQAEPPLVAKLAELKMIRSLQLRINRRTAELAQIVERKEVPFVEIEPLLKQLAERQAKVSSAARDLHSGRND